MAGGQRAKRVEEFQQTLFTGDPFTGKELDSYRSYTELYEKRTERTAAAMDIVRENQK